MCTGDRALCCHHGKNQPALGLRQWLILRFHLLQWPLFYPYYRVLVQSMETRSAQSSIRRESLPQAGFLFAGSGLRAIFYSPFACF